MFVCEDCVRGICELMIGEHALRSYGMCEICEKVHECVECPPTHARKKKRKQRPS